MSEVKALVLAGYGINCDWETAHVLNLAGAWAERVHVSDLTGAPGYPATQSLADCHILVFDGGFSWADDHGAGVLLANRLKNHLGDQLMAFLERGGLVLGICNGFQALVNLGILPMLNGSLERQAALTANDCGNFQDRWVELVALGKSPCLFTRGLDRLDLPVRHGEGKLTAEPKVLKAILKKGLAPLVYGDGKGDPAQGEWPANPNGSAHDIAGLTDPTGRVFGLMPHPEGFYRMSQHPDYTLLREKTRRRGGDLPADAPGLGLAIFQNAVQAARDAL